MKKLKTQKGITLVALIITIVVLLILAVVTIGAIQESKIIAHAKNASTSYNDEKAKEESAIAGYESLIDSYLPRKNGESDNQGGEDEGELNTPSDEELEDTVFVEYKLWTEPKSSNQTFSGASTGSGTNPIIPAGFMPKNTETAKWDAESGPEGENGLVVMDELGNEFVWIPLTVDIDLKGYNLNTNGEREPDVIIGEDRISYDAVATNLLRAECEDIDKDGILESLDFKTELENIYKSMSESANKYDGFYVGRFETSRNGENPQSKASTEGKIIETAYNSSSENDWYGLYALNKKYKTSSVQGSMIWGIQYDEMMAWIGDAANTKIGDKRNIRRTCGTAADDIIKNVYDLYGNSWEWTIEADRKSYRVMGGGTFQHDSVPSHLYCCTPTSTDSFSASRLSLYILED